MNEDLWLIYLNYLGEKHTRNNIGGASEQCPTQIVVTSTICRHMHQPVKLHADGYHFTYKYGNQINAYRHADDDTQPVDNMTHGQKFYSYRILVNDILKSNSPQI